MPSPFLEDLDARGLVADATDELGPHLAGGSRTIYVGFDPTADSLHVGSLLPLLALRRAQLAGHRPIVLVGGGTGLIGDPSGKTGERALNPKEVVQEWAERLKRQVSLFLDFERGRLSAVLADNYEWISGLDVVSFLRDVGKHFSLSTMLAKESVRARLGRADSGISYTEFSYQVLQAYDFLCLRRRHDCTVQMGGSDQWGNNTAGIDLIRRVEGRAAFGLTLPLVTKTDGSKFGKTESGTIWLDPARSPAYEMYQFWLNTADSDVVRFLRHFTFLSAEEIGALAQRTAGAPEKREAQRVLATEVTKLVHGEGALRKAERATAEVFQPETVDEMEAGSLEGGALPVAFVNASESRFLWSVIRDAGIASASEARRLIRQGGVTVDRQRVSDVDFKLTFGSHLLQIGKRRFWKLFVGPDYETRPWRPEAGSAPRKA
jgi:tyrosyl-tRNA synthetase